MPYFQFVRITDGAIYFNFYFERVLKACPLFKFAHFIFVNILIANIMASYFIVIKKGAI